MNRPGLQNRHAAGATNTTSITAPAAENDVPVWLRSHPADIAPILGGVATNTVKVETKPDASSQTPEPKSLVDVIWPYISRLQLAMSQNSQISALVALISSSRPSVRFSPSAARAKQLFKNFQIYVWSAEGESTLIS